MIPGQSITSLRPGIQVVFLFLGFLPALSLLLAQPARSAQSTQSAEEFQAVVSTLRQHLLSWMPEPLYYGEFNWGKTSQVPHALKWRQKGIFLRPEVHDTARNDGTWRKVTVRGRNLPSTFLLDFRDFRHSDTDHMHFTTIMSFMAQVDFEQQNWESGIRLYSGSLRARFRVWVKADCELLLRLEPGKSIIPDAIFRLRVTQAQVSYNDLVTEHIAGVGGTAARLLGEGLQDTLRQWRPSVERDLLARANQAIVRSADTREIRLSLDSLLRMKGKG